MSLPGLTAAPWEAAVNTVALLPRHGLHRRPNLLEGGEQRGFTLRP